VGDCDQDGAVTIDELLTMVNVSLASFQPSVCPPGDRNGDGDITIEEIIAAINRSLLGC
jgi:Ca2+-binding EF-hand superfamily protein